MIKPTRRSLTCMMSLLFLIGWSGGDRLSAMDIPQEYKVGGFAVGLQAFSFHRLPVLETIEKTAQAGGRTIEFFGRQPFSSEDPELLWNHHATEEMIRAVEARLSEFDVLPVNYGVVQIPQNEAEARKIFEFAQRLGLRAITTESEGSIDLIEKLVREYDIKVAFHHHGRNPDRPDYRLWDPNYLRDLVKDRDERIGVCPDIGHFILSDLDPVESLRILRGRIISVHMNDRRAEDNRAVSLGMGIGNIAGVLSELREQGFTGHLSIEQLLSLPEIAQSVGFIRGVGASQGWE